MPDLSRPVDKHSYRTSYPLTHDINLCTRSRDQLDLLVGFNGGPIQRLNPITKASLGVFNGDVSWGITPIMHVTHTHTHTGYVHVCVQSICVVWHACNILRVRHDDTVPEATIARLCHLMLWYFADCGQVNFHSKQYCCCLKPSIHYIHVGVFQKL